MNVVLREDVEKLGKRGETVKVADGYGRNYLIPKKLAYPATPGNQKVIEHEKRAKDLRDARVRQDHEKVAAVISALQFGIGLALTATSAPGPAHLLFTSVDRLDGVKMLALAVLGAAAATMIALPRWLRWTGIALAVAITCSGLVYLLLIAPLAAAAGPALVLLLVFMTGCGIMIGMTADPRDH